MEVEQGTFCECLPNPSSDSPSPQMRECGPCTACCTVFAISELEKGMFETCRHVCETGCAVYRDRPEPCSAFQCQWLRGVLEVDGAVDPALRPNASGVIIDFQPKTEDGDLYVAWEIWPGASDSEPARTVLEELTEQFLVMIVTRGSEGDHGVGDRRFLGPADRVAQANERMAGSRKRLRLRVYGQ